MVMRYKQNLQSRVELYRRVSINRLTGEPTMLRILAGPGGRDFYDEETKKMDRLIYIELSQNDTIIEFPYGIRDQEKMWELVFDVWVKPEKIIQYAMRFHKLIDSKLAQRKLTGMAKAYIIKEQPQ